MKIDGLLPYINYFADRKHQWSIGTIAKVVSNTGLTIDDVLDASFLASEHGAAAWLYASAPTGVGVDDISDAVLMHGVDAIAAVFDGVNGLLPTQTDSGDEERGATLDGVNFAPSFALALKQGLSIEDIHNLTLGALFELLTPDREEVASDGSGYGIDALESCY